jgi:hypothetical protein
MHVVQESAPHAIVSLDEKANLEKIQCVSSCSHQEMVIDFEK